MSKGGIESKWNKNKSTRNKWRPPRVHRMNWKVHFGDLPVEDRRTTKNERRTTKKGWKSSRNHPRKRYGSASAWIFFTDTIFSLISSDSRITRKAEPFFLSPVPLFIGKWGRSLPSSSPRRARLLPVEATAFWRNFLEGRSGPGCYLHPHFY